MDRIKAVLEEINLKAANSSNVYDLIMDLMKETSSKMQDFRGSDRFLNAEVVGKAEDRGQL